LALTVLALAAAPLPQSDALPLSEPEREKIASKIDQVVLDQLLNTPDEPLTVIVHIGGSADLSGAAAFADYADKGVYVYQTLQTFAEARQAGIRAYLQQEQARGRELTFRPFFIFNGLALTATPDLIWQIAARNDVQAITPNNTYQLDRDWRLETQKGAQSPVSSPQSLNLSISQSPLTPEWNIAKINADDVWATYGITGTGVLVANLDSGVQYNHPALVRQYAGNSGGGLFNHDFHWYDATGLNAAAPYDDNGHGTHTMGTMAGGDGPGPFADDIGVAPGTDWIAVKAFNAQGTGDAVHIHAAFEWLLAPCPAGVQPGSPSCDPARAPRIVNNSWGSNNGARIEFLPDVQALRASGIWPEFSAGNNGPGVGTIGSPASFAEAFATGATDINDVVASFSARGPSPLTDEIKPDVSAPGVNVRSSLPGNGYGAFNGTSMASPHVSGLAALMLAAEPNLDLDTLEAIIRNTAIDLGAPGPDMVYGYGRIDALAAMERLVSSGDLAGLVRDDTTLAPIAGAEVQAQGQGLDETATANLSGQYTLSYLLNGAYTVTGRYYGYEPFTVTNVTIITDQITTLNLDLHSLPRYTISGHVYDAISPTVPITNARITALDTPLPFVQTDANGYYEIEVAEGGVVLEAAAFGYATNFTSTLITANTTIDFYLDPLPPVLLVDDDEGNLRSYSPHVESYYFTALDANGYNYVYWDLEAEGGAPTFDYMRQFRAVIWFGGEFGRIKDISDAAQAQVVMNYLDLGGNFFYIAQEHTFYYGDDAPCDPPTGPCPFSRDYLGLQSFTEDRRAQVHYGVAGNPVGAGLGPIPMVYPAGLTDFSDNIVGTASASLAFTATDSTPPGEVNMTTYTHISPTVGFKLIFMATPLEAMSDGDAADVMYSAMQWFGVAGLAEGLTLVPPQKTDKAYASDTISYTLRVRNLSDFPDTFSLTVINSVWPTSIRDATFSTPITELGPIPPDSTADFGVVIEVPAGSQPGAQTSSLIRATSQSSTPFMDETTLIAQARMSYYYLDSDQCDSGVHYAWVDARAGTRWDLDDSGSTSLPEFVSVPLPEPFTYYNVTYDHLWVNDHGAILFGDDNIYNDSSPSGIPPIPNSTLSDPNAAIYLAWGNLFWHPTAQHPDSAVYTYHDTSSGRNWFVVEYYLYENLLEDQDTFQAILDLDSGDVTVQYQVISYHNFTVVGIENQTGLEGVLYINDQQPPQNVLHNELAVRFGVGDPDTVLEVALDPATASQTGTPGGQVDYLLTLTSTSSINDSYNLEAVSNWPTTIWDATFTNQISQIGPLSPCSSQQIGVRVELPATTSYVYDVATIRARSQTDPLLTASSQLTTDNADPGVLVGPSQASSGASGTTVSYTMMVTNTGNVTDTYDLALTGFVWPTDFNPPVTQTNVLPPGSNQSFTVEVDIPANVPANGTDTAVMNVTSQNYPLVTDSAVLTTTAAASVGVNIEEYSQAKTGAANTVVSYYAYVRNTGNQNDSFSLEALGNTWETTIWNETFTQQINQTQTLGPDENQRIGIRVRVDSGAAAPDQDVALIQAISGLDNTVSDLTLVTTGVTPATPGTHSVVLAPAGDWAAAEPGDVVPFTLTLTNTGSLVDSYTVTASGNDWTAQVTGNFSTVAPGTARMVTVMVTVPNNASEGEWDQVTLTARSLANPPVHDRADLVVALNQNGPLIPPPVPTGSFIYLPVVMKP
jgi:subtilisin family serine protease